MRGEVVHAGLHGDRAARQLGFAQPRGHPRRHPIRDRGQQRPVHDVGVEGVLDADRLGLPVADDRAVVVGHREPVQSGSVRGAELADELVQAELLQVADGSHARHAEPLRRRRADTGDHRHLHRRQEVRLGAGRHHDDPVGLVEVAGDLRDQLRRTGSHRRGQPAARGVDRILQLPADRGHLVDADTGHAGGAQVDEGLVQRQGLHQWRQGPHPRHHRRARRPVRVEPPTQERRVRAARPGLRGRHRRAHAVRPRLVRRRGHHAAQADPADHDGFAPQRRLVALLDRGEERVQVDMQDRRLGAHDDILARRSDSSGHRVRQT